MQKEKCSCGLRQTTAEMLLAITSSRRENTKMATPCWYLIVSSMNENTVGTREKSNRLYYCFPLAFWRKMVFFRNREIRLLLWDVQGPKNKERGGGWNSRMVQESCERWGRRRYRAGGQKRRCYHKEYNFEDKDILRDVWDFQLCDGQCNSLPLKTPSVKIHIHLPGLGVRIV